MADLKISQLPSAETLANTDLIPVKTTAGTKAITFENLKASQEGYFKKVADDYMAFDYEDLAALRADGDLIAGATYLLTDYQTVYRQSRPEQTPDYADKVSAVEPLVLTAISTDEFSSIAYSPAYPQDIIWYNFDNELSPDNTSLFYNSLDRISKGFKGIIIRRIDTQKNIDYSYDWRTMLWWRDGNEVLTFADLNTIYNVVSGSNCYENTFGSNCSRNTFGSNCYDNAFGSNCSSNTLGNNCSSNTLGNYCSKNTFDSYCDHNTFGSDCYSNTLGSNCYDNTFGSDCYSNTLGGGCSSNTFDNYCHSNTFGNYCSNNTLGSNCFGNTFSSYCYSNTFDNYLKYADVKSNFNNATVTNPAIYNKNYNHIFYVDSSGNKKCYCINSSGAITDVPLDEPLEED